MMASLVIDKTLAAGRSPLRRARPAAGPGQQRGRRQGRDRQRKATEGQLPLPRAGPHRLLQCKRHEDAGGEPQWVLTGRQVGESGNQGSGCATQKGRTNRGNITVQARASLELV